MDDVVERLSKVLEGSTLESKGRRDDVIAQLPSDMKGNIERRADIRADIRNIVATCDKYHNGLCGVYWPLWRGWKGKAKWLLRHGNWCDQNDL